MYIYIYIFIYLFILNINLHNERKSWIITVQCRAEENILRSPLLSRAKATVITETDRC